MIEKRSDDNLRCVVCGALVDEPGDAMLCANCLNEKTAEESGSPRTLREYVRNSDE